METFLSKENIKLLSYFNNECFIVNMTFNENVKYPPELKMLKKMKPKDAIVYARMLIKKENTPFLNILLQRSTCMKVVTHLHGYTDKHIGKCHHPHKLTYYSNEMCAYKPRDYFAHIYYNKGKEITISLDGNETEHVKLMPFKEIEWLKYQDSVARQHQLDMQKQKDDLLNIFFGSEQSTSPMMIQ